jgi:hypothetical protein
MLGHGFHVHHVDHNHANNDPRNLILIEAEDHMRLHAMKMRALQRLEFVGPPKPARQKRERYVFVGPPKSAMAPPPKVPYIWPAPYVFQGLPKPPRPPKAAPLAPAKRRSKSLPADWWRDRGYL